MGTCAPSGGRGLVRLTVLIFGTGESRSRVRCSAPPRGDEAHIHDAGRTGTTGIRLGATALRPTYKLSIWGDSKESWGNSSAERLRDSRGPRR